MKKMMKKSKSLKKLPDLEALKPSPLKRSLSQPGKPPPFHFTTEAPFSPLKEVPFTRNNGGSPNYMKPTSSSGAKKELFPVNLPNSQTCSDWKRKFSSNSMKAGSFSGNKPEKTLTISSSLKLVRTLTKLTNFKPVRACSRKSSRVALCADVNAKRAPCSSTLKDSEFPRHLVLNHGSTESEGTSSMKVCPYTYCSLNGHASLPPLNSFVPARRRLSKIENNLMQESLCPQSLEDLYVKKVMVVHDVFVERQANVSNVNQEIGMNVIIDAKEKEHKARQEMGKLDSAKESDDKEHIKYKISYSRKLAQGDGDMKNVLGYVSERSPESEIDSDEDFRMYFDDVEIEADNKRSFLRKQKAEYANEDHPPTWFREEISMGSNCSEMSYERENLDSIAMDDSDSEAASMKWKNGEICTYKHEEDDVSSVLTDEKPDSLVKSSWETSHDGSVMGIEGDMVKSYYEDMLADQVLQEAIAEEGSCNVPVPGQKCTIESTEPQEFGYSFKMISSDQFSSMGNAFHKLTNAKENDRKNETDEVAGILQSSQECYVSNQIVTDEEDSMILKMENAEIYQDVEDFDHSQNACEAVTIKDRRGSIRHRRNNKDNDEELRNFNPKEPNFLPLAPDPETEKVTLKHQLMDERKDGEEWMLDYALRQAVTKLAPARKKKVSLLVEAFEAVMPMTKCEAHIRNSSSFTPASPIQSRS